MKNLFVGSLPQSIPLSVFLILATAAAVGLFLLCRYCSRAGEVPTERMKHMINEYADNFKEEDYEAWQKKHQ